MASFKQIDTGHMFRIKERLSMFILKKIISPLFMPMTMFTILLTIGVVMLWFNLKQKAAKMIITISCFLFILLSSGVLSSWPLERLENTYHPLEVKKVGAGNIKWIVVLAGRDDESVVRLVEGVRIYRCLSVAKLVVSGGKVYASDSEPSSEKMAKIAVELGVKPSDIVIENMSRDTKDEARILRLMIGQKPFILVTSAYHMPRSMELFIAQGMHPEPAPTDYRSRKEENHIYLEWFYPGANKILDAEIVTHEILGIVSAKIMGQF